jgi:DNA polymerase-3 subunit beta
MKVTVARDVLTNGIRKTTSAVNSKTTIPVLSNILIEADAGKIVLTATDLEVCIRTELEAEVAESGKTTVPARKFSQIVGALAGDKVTLETNDNQQTSISCGKSFFKILGLDAEEFPLEEGVDASWSFSLPAADFRRNLGKVAYAASTDETRHVLNGILLSIRNGVLTSVATDGRRLALVEQNLEGDVPEDCDVILPAKVVNELLKVLDSNEPLSIDLSDARASFTVNGTRITSKLVEGSYPNYRQVIPGAFSQSAVIPRDEFVTVLNRVSMMVSESSASVSLKLENAKMIISATSAEFGEANEPMQVSYDAQDLEISFNPVFLGDPLRHLEAEQVVMQFNDEFSPISISGDEGFLCVIMPMRS